MLLEFDDFTGPDGSAPNATIWRVVNTHSDDYVEIRSNTLKTHSQGNGYAYIVGNEHHLSNNLTLLVDHRMTVRSGRSIDVRIVSNDSIREYRWLSVMFDADAGYGTVNYRYNDREFQITYYQDFVLGRWYTVNITVMTDTFNVTVKERDTGTEFLSVVDRTCDPLGSDNYAYIGVFQYHTTSSAEAYYDNYRLYDISPIQKLPPVWGDLPVLEAVEDIPITYDFSPIVSDPDDVLANLSISSTSDYVASIRHLNVTFLFPEGVTEAEVTLVLTDGRFAVPTVVTFWVTPVNDPPEHNLPNMLSAVEDVPLSVNLSSFVWDIDNETTDLHLEEDDPFASTDGLELTVLFPEGVRDHYLTVYVSDGLLRTAGLIHFNITPVDDPPEVAPLGEMVVVEDQDTVLDLAPYIDDVDTPMDEIHVLVRDRNCTVEGRRLHFLCTRGNVTYTADVEISDRRNRVFTNLTIIVQEVNDAPIIGLLPPQEFVEEEEGYVNLLNLVSDEDTPLSELVLECDHEALVRIEGLMLTLNYTEWMLPHDVNVSVFDGLARTRSSFSVQVRAVNDPPQITWRPDITAQREFEIDEGGELWYSGLTATDEDDTEFHWSLASDFYGFHVLANGTLHMHAEKGDVGQYTATVEVEDPHGARGTMAVTLTVMNVNDPPLPPELLLPLNQSVHRLGDNITFAVRVFDPDQVLGQVLVVTWRSNLTDVFMVLNSGDNLSFNRANLPAGLHRIEVTVSDGEHSRTAWLELEVEPPPKPPGEEPRFQVSIAQVGLILLVILAIIGVALAVVYKTRRPPDEEPPPEEEAPVVAELSEAASPPSNSGDAEAAGWVPEEE